MQLKQARGKTLRAFSLYTALKYTKQFRKLCKRQLTNIKYLSLQRLQLPLLQIRKLQTQTAIGSDPDLFQIKPRYSFLIFCQPCSKSAKAFSTASRVHAKCSKSHGKIMIPTTLTSTTNTLWYASIPSIQHRDRSNNPTKTIQHTSTISAVRSHFTSFFKTFFPILLYLSNSDTPDVSPVFPLCNPLSHHAGSFGCSCPVLSSLSSRS